ncbi:DUF5777 family beta-barrel protein [Mucilaginibacter sp.]|uniref:DUF5777 family beta-barrel protein n=1 Tax=Mucilaginibacter sp. TaxID=1882438 RepID=UPI002B80BB2C|nr:DUF5777 family beta-barrel protein [Mucilaginibacter sp.]HTI59103.1 DUF5777 family beta-barrel protein [Mucilaginibacter sp.]
MKPKINFAKRLLTAGACLVSCILSFETTTYAQDTTAVVKEAGAPVKAKPVKNTFQSIWLIDNQTVMVPFKGTFEMDIQHRFGTVDKGYSDLWGLYASSNIRIGVGYAPINNLYLGIGLNKYDELWDVSAKYALLKQTPGESPVSITYYGDLSYDTRKDATKDLFAHQSDRFLSFNQIIIARKFSDKLSLQVAPSITHQNAVNGYYTKNDSTGQTIFEEMKHDHFAVSVSGRYKLSDATAVLVNYDQPITKHATNNPSPNLSFGFEFATSGHTFQLFMGNYSLLNPGKNNLFNANSPFNYTQADGTRVKGGKFVIGFNITRLWN